MIGPVQVHPWHLGLACQALRPILDDVTASASSSHCIGKGREGPQSPVAPGWVSSLSFNAPFSEAMEAAKGPLQKGLEVITYGKGAEREKMRRCFDCVFLCALLWNHRKVVA